jgi:TM2 domain-containing membrane protein YozV
VSQNQGSGWGAPSTDQPPAGQQQPPASQQQPPGNWAPPPPPPNQQASPSKYCQACGASIDSRAEICPNCGVRQGGAVTGETKSRPLAIVLALLLGGFGIHRFYVGPMSWGIAYLVFFWTGIPAFLGWLEAIYWLTQSDDAWAQKYGGQAQESNGCAIGCLWALALLPLIGIVLGGAILIFSIPFALGL